jgi:hypothetical protein
MKFENIDDLSNKITNADNFKIYTDAHNTKNKSEIPGSPTIVSLNEKSLNVTTQIINEQLNQSEDILSIDAKDQKTLKKETHKHNSKSKLPTNTTTTTSPQYKIISSETLDLNDIGNNKCIQNEELTSSSIQNSERNPESNIELGLGGLNTNEKADIKNKNAKLTSAHVHTGGTTQITRVNASAKLFKPILNFIGIDAPSGTLMDNLFKEFGSLISGNLHIKSVDINILGKQQGSNLNSSFSQSHMNDMNRMPKVEPVKLRSFYTSKKTNFFNMNTNNTNNNEQNRVITTILSFDSLLFNLNVRQVFPNRLNNKNFEVNASTRVGNFATTDIGSTVKGKKDGLFSMVNPIYVSSKENESNNLALNVYEPKYYTKIDTGIQLNNLSQEVNMPLLRLVHQLYSLIADAIEFDKEPNKFVAPELFVEVTAESNNNKSSPQLRDANRHEVKFNKIDNDCWHFIESIIDLEPKCIEKNETSSPSSMKKTQKAAQKQSIISKEAFVARDQSIISFFGWMYIKRVNSKAGLGTLAFNGEMNDIQFDVLLEQKIQPTSSKIQYEGSANLCICSTLGKLTENDTKQNVVQMSLGKSHVFGYLKNLSMNNVISSFVHVGQIYIDVPLRPMVVHGVVYRESKVIEQKILPEIKNFVIFENEEQKSDNENNLGMKENQAAATDGLLENNLSKEKDNNEKKGDSLAKNSDMADSTKANENTNRRNVDFEKKNSSKLKKPPVIFLNGNANNRKAQQAASPHLTIDHSNKTGILELVFKDLRPF